MPATDHVGRKILVRSLFGMLTIAVIWIMLSPSVLGIFLSPDGSFRTGTVEAVRDFRLACSVALCIPLLLISFFPCLRDNRAKKNLRKLAQGIVAGGIACTLSVAIFEGVCRWMEKPRRPNTSENMFTFSDMSDIRSLCSRLCPKNVSYSGGRFQLWGSAVEKVLECMPPDVRAVVCQVSESGKSSEEEAKRVLDGLNRVLFREYLTYPDLILIPARSEYVGLIKSVRGSPSPERTVRLNRLLIESLFQTEIVRNEPQGWLLAMHRSSENPNLVYEMVPGTALRKHNILYRINTNGFRGAEWPFDSAICAAMVVGDSVVFGDGVAEDQCLGSLISRGLQECSSSNVWAASLGVGGYGTFQELELVRTFGPRLNPEVVILVVCLNDVDNPYQHIHVPYDIKYPIAAIPDPSSLVGEGMVIKGVDGLIHHAGIRFSAFYRRAASLRGRRSWENCLVALADKESKQWVWMKKQIAELNTACSAMGSRLVVVINPLRYQLLSSYALAIKPQQTIVEYCTRVGIPCIDMTAEFFRHGGETLFVDECHLSAEGHRLVANKVLEYVCPFVKQRLGGSASHDMAREYSP